MGEAGIQYSGEPVERALTPQECADALLGGVQFDPNPTKGTGSFLDGMRVAVTTLCVTSGIEQVGPDTTVWQLIQRTSELNGSEIPDNVRALEGTLSQPLNGDVIEVMLNAGLGLDSPLTQHVQELQKTMTPKQNAQDLSEDL